MTDVMQMSQSYSQYSNLYAYQQQRALQFGANSSQQTTGVPGALSNIYGSQDAENQETGHLTPQIRGHVNVSMTHLQQGAAGGHVSHLDGIATKMEPDQSVQAAAQQHATLGTLNQVQQIPTTSTYAPTKPAGDMIDIKKYYENDEEEDQILDQQFTKSFGENKPRHRVPAGFPASFYTQSTSPQRSSSTSGYNGSLSGSVSPSNPYSQAFQSGQTALGGLYGGNSFHHPATSPLATTNNGSTQDWAYAAQAAYTAQAAFGTAHASNYNQTAAVAAGAQATGLHGQYNPAHAALTSALPTSASGGYPFSSQQDQHRQAAFATGFPQY